MAPTTDSRIKWRSSAAREIILEDLEPGGILYQQDSVPAAEVFEFYECFPEFEDVKFEQFEARLKDHRAQAARRILRSQREEACLRHDRLLHPRQTHNERGEPVFDMTKAKELLQEDVKNKVHETMEARDLQLSRIEYRPFQAHIFSQRIKQEVRRQKYFYYLELKRTVKRTKYKEAKAKKRANAP
jgi:hypothetical protein